MATATQPLSASQGGTGGFQCQPITDVQTLQTAVQQLEKQKVEMLSAFHVLHKMVFKSNNFWGIQENGQWVGLARTQILKGDEFHLEQISTAKGYGQKLMNFLVYQAKTKFNAKVFTLTAANPVLYGFYKKCGFTQVKETSGEFTYDLKDAGLSSVPIHQKNDEMEKARYLQGEAFSQFPDKVAAIINAYL